MPNWSLRTRFLLFALACLIPLTAVVGYYLDRSRDRSVTQTIAYETTLASQTSRSLSSFLDANADAVEALAQNEFVVGLAPEESANALGTLRSARQELAGLFLISHVDGQLEVVSNSGIDPEPLLPLITTPLQSTISQGVISVSQPIPLDAETNGSDSQPVLPDAETSSSDSQSVPTDDEVNVIVLTVPVITVTTTGTDPAAEAPDDTASPSDPVASTSTDTQPPGQTIGAIGAVIPVERLAEWTLPNSRGQSEIAVASVDEVLIATSGINPDGQEFVDDQQEHINLALEGEINNFRYTNQNEVRQIAVAAPVAYENADWSVIVTQPLPAIMQGLSTPEVVFVFALAVIVIVAMAVVLGEVTAQPLRTLGSQAQALHQGRLKGPIRVGGTGEIRSLGLHFAEMADQINTQVAVLEEAGHDRERQAAQMRDLLRRTNRLQEDERRRIAGEMHDAVSPLITGALYQTRALQMANGSTPHEERESALRSVNELLERATEELHGVIFDLRPPDLDDLGVVAAIEAYVHTMQRTGLSCRLEIIGETPSLTPEVRLSIYRIVQEALHNVIRHAGADEAVVRLETSDDLLRVTIRDNGAGFDPSMAVRPTSLGLLSMQERAESIGATFNIVSKPGGGTAIVIERLNSGDVMSDEVLESMMLQVNGWNELDHEPMPSESSAAASSEST